MSMTNESFMNLHFCAKTNGSLVMADWKADTHCMGISKPCFCPFLTCDV